MSFIPEWTEKMNAYGWMAVAGILLVATSIIYDDKYISLWLITYIYGLLGFSNNVGLEKYPRIKKTVTVILLFIYLLVFIFLGYKLTDVSQYIASYKLNKLLAK